MDTITATKAEIQAYPLNSGNNTLVRRLLFIPNIDTDSCIPENLNIANYYPKNYINGQYKCHIEDAIRGNQLLGRTSIESKFLKSIAPVILPDTIDSLKNKARDYSVPMYITIDTLEDVPDLEIRNAKHILDWVGKDIIIHGKFEFILTFVKCTKYNHNTCFKEDHEKEWSLEMKCISGSVVEITHNSDHYM